MTEIYRVAFGFVRENPAFFVAMGLMLFAASVFSEIASSGTTIVMIAHVFITFGLHRGLMYGEANFTSSSRKTPLRPLAIGRFMIVALGLGLMIVGLVIGGMLASPGGIDSLQQSDIQFFAKLISLCGLASLVILTLFGTALPAAASADRFGFALTLQRARKTWKSVAFGLVVGPGLAFMVILAAQTALLIAGLTPAPVYSQLGGFNLVAGIMDFILTLASLFVTLLAVTVLCQNYRKVAPPDVAAAMAEAEAPATLA